MILKTLVIAGAVLAVIVFAGCAGLKHKDQPVGSDYDEKTMESLVKPPESKPWYIGWMIRIADRKAGKKMLTGRVLAWSPKISISSGLLELYVEEGAASILNKRLIALVRMIISYTAPSSFAIDINSAKYKKYDITAEEIAGLRGEKDLETISSFSIKEKSALEYARAVSKTPIVMDNKILNRLRYNFSEREIVALAALSAKVNYWARLLEGLRIKPAGYTDDPVLHLADYNTLVE